MTTIFYYFIISCSRTTCSVSWTLWRCRARFRIVLSFTLSFFFTCITLFIKAGMLAHQLPMSGVRKKVRTRNHYKITISSKIISSHFFFFVCVGDAHGHSYKQVDSCSGMNVLFYVSYLPLVGSASATEARASTGLYFLKQMQCS